MYLVEGLNPKLVLRKVHTLGDNMYVTLKKSCAIKITFILLHIPFIIVIKVWINLSYLELSHSRLLEKNSGISAINFRVFGTFFSSEVIVLGRRTSFNS